MKATVLGNSCSLNLAEVVHVELKQVAKRAYLVRQDLNDLDQCWSTMSCAIVRHSTCWASVGHHYSSLRCGDEDVSPHLCDEPSAIPPDNDVRKSMDQRRRESLPRRIIARLAGANCDL